MLVAHGKCKAGSVQCTCTLRYLSLLFLDTSRLKETWERAGGTTEKTPCHHHHHHQGYWIYSRHMTA